MTQRPLTLRDFILDEMHKRDMSGRQFAEFVGVAQSTISRAIDEREPTGPGVELMLKLADATHTDVTTIFALAFPDVAARTKLSPDAALMAQRIEQLPEHLQEAIRVLIRGSR